MVLICRLCLKSYPKSRPELIFSVNARDQNGLAVTTLIKTLIPEVYLGLSNDPLICHICYKTLYDAYSFRLRCLRSENLIGIYMREQDTLSSTTNVRLEDVIAYWTDRYCTKRGASEIAKENLVDWFGVHVLDDQIGPETNGSSNKSDDLHTGEEIKSKIDEKMSTFVKNLPTPTLKVKSVEEISSDDLEESQNVIPQRKPTNTADVQSAKGLSKTAENKRSEPVLEKDPLENTAKETEQIKAVTIKKEIVEEPDDSGKLEKEAELLKENPVVTPEPVLTPLTEEPNSTRTTSMSDDTLTSSDKEMDQPLIKLRKVTTLKKSVKPTNYVRIKTLRPVGTRKVGKPFKRNSKFPAGGFLKVKSSDLQPLLLDKPVPDQNVGEEPGALLRPVAKNSGNMLSKPGTKLMALTVDQLNAFLKSNNMVTVPASSLSPEGVTAETASVLGPGSDPPKKPTVGSTKTSQSLEETSKISEPTVKVKQEPEETKEPTRCPVSQDASSSEAWGDGETITASETSLVDRLIDAEMPVLGDYEFDQPEYVSVTQVTNWEDMPILEPAMLTEKKEQVLPSKIDETPENSLATRIKEQIKVKMTAAKQKPNKRVAITESEEAPAAKMLKKETPKPEEVAQITEQKEISDEPKDICVLYTKFTSEGHYMNDHDYLISPYLRNNMITYRSGRRMCMCLLCDSSHPDSNHVKHMKYHSTKCIICNADFKNVFILNLHVRGHTKRCFECEVNVTYARYHHHEQVHPLRVLKNEQARREEEQAEADSILKVLLAEKVDIPTDIASTSQSQKRTLRGRRNNRPATTKTRNLRKRTPRKKAEEITLMDLLNSSVKPDANNLDLEQLSAATQNSPVSSNTADEPVKKTTRRRKKKFLLGRRKKAAKSPKKNVKTETEEDEFQIEYFPLRMGEGESSEVKPKTESKPVVRRRQARLRSPIKSVSPVPNVEIEEVKDPLSFDTEEMTETDFSNIPVKSSLLFETMTPIKIVKMESNKIVVTPIGPVMTVRPTSPFQKSKRRKTATDIEPKSRFDTLIEETERHIREARSLRKSLTLKANLKKQQKAESTVISTRELIPLEVPTKDDIDPLERPIKEEKDPLS